MVCVSDNAWHIWIGHSWSCLPCLCTGEWQKPEAPAHSYAVFPASRGRGVAEPQALTIPVQQGLHEEAGTHSHFKIQMLCKQCKLRSSVNEGSFLNFSKKKKKSLQHGFQSIFSIKHENIDEWEIITKAVYLYIALHNMFLGTVII